ncbi:MAG: hypothetical protein IID45_02100 [Planctomycetes bacterium]|nr:hypothetical protein [Planctomycetota bacterium]
MTTTWERFPSNRLAPRVPCLLVSVRDVLEARAAVAGGCEILDVKEPAHGSLGMADPGMIAEILESVPENHPPVSAAAGETTDWLDGKTPPALPAKLAYVKLGTANLLDRTNGLQNWAAVRREFDVAAGSPFHWIAVAYADWKRACAPRPEAVIEAAIKTKCAGVLFDTFVKDGRALTEWISADELNESAQRVHNAGMPLALAGSLRGEHLPAVCRCRPDIIAVRSAACEQGERTGRVTTAAVAAFHAELRAESDNAESQCSGC